VKIAYISPAQSTKNIWKSKS